MMNVIGVKILAMVPVVILIAHHHVIQLQVVIGIVLLLAVIMEVGVFERGIGFAEEVPTK